MCLCLMSRNSSSHSICNALTFWGKFFPVSMQATRPNAAFNTSSRPVFAINTLIQPTKLINMCKPPKRGKKLGNNSGCTHKTLAITRYNCWSAMNIVNVCPHFTVSLCASYMAVIKVSGSEGTMSISGVYITVVAGLRRWLCSLVFCIKTTIFRCFRYTCYAFKKSEV